MIYGVFGSQLFLNEDDDGTSVVARFSESDQYSSGCAGGGGGGGARRQKHESIVLFAREYTFCLRGRYRRLHSLLLRFSARGEEKVTRCPCYMYEESGDHLREENEFIWEIETGVPYP